jgi:hypothetical protein
LGLPAMIYCFHVVQKQSLPSLILLKEVSTRLQTVWPHYSFPMPVLENHSYSKWCVTLEN